MIGCWLYRKSAQRVLDRRCCGLSGAMGGGRRHDYEERIQTLDQEVFVR